MIPPADDARNATRAGSGIGPRQRLEAALKRMDALNPRYRAMVTVDRQGARAAAADVERRLSEGEALPLGGMLVCVKDNIDTSGLRTAAGSRMYEHRVPGRDATVVDRLRKAGAVVVGKASMMELAFGHRTADAIGGQCRNPWNADRVPGGSSGGTAASVALDFCVAGLGTDTGGSVRMPSAFCGVTGLRPTHGRIPNTSTIPVSVAFDTIGPVARRIEDVAAVYEAIAGYDAEDAHSVDRPVERWDGSAEVRGLRVGVPSRFYFDDVDADVAAAVRTVIDQLAAAGATIVDIAMTGADEAQSHATTIILADVCAVHEAALDRGRELMSDQVYERMIKGRRLSGTDYAKALRFRERWAQTMRALFQDVDVVLMPTTPAPAPPIEDGLHLEVATRVATRFTFGGSLAATPGLSLPCGFSARGLPIGVLIEAPWWCEARLFAVGAWWQRRTDFHLQIAPAAAGPTDPTLNRRGTS